MPVWTGWALTLMPNSTKPQGATEFDAHPIHERRADNLDDSIFVTLSYHILSCNAFKMSCLKCTVEKLLPLWNCPETPQLLSSFAFGQKFVWPG